MWSRFKNYLIGARQEFRQVHWPSREEAIRLTSVVILVSIALAIFLGLFDELFTYLLKVLIIR